MMVMMMAMTPSLNASSLLLFMAGRLFRYAVVNCMHGDNSMRKFLWALTFAGAAAAAAPSRSVPPAADQQLARDMLKGLVEINTTHEHGSTDAAKAIQGWLLSAGFGAEDVVFLAPPDHPTKGSVVVRYRGKHPGAAPVLFLGHLDVVDAKPEDWSVDPFKLTQQDGWFYGRGTIDMKDGDAALVESLIRLKREGFVPERDVIAAFTADEEAGGTPTGPPSCSRSIES